MAREFRLPDIGEGLTEAEIIRWLVAVGDQITADQPIVEVETDKAVVEIPSPYAGEVVSLGGAEGDVIEVGAILITVGEPGEAERAEEPAPVGEPEADEDATSESATDTWPSSGDSAPIVGTLSDEAESLSAPAERTEAVPTAIKALPVVRKLARDNDVDLESLTGSGPGGRIMREDVEAAIGQRSPQPEPEPRSEPEPQRLPEPEPEKTTRPAPVEHAIHDEAVGGGHGVSDEHLAPPTEAPSTEPSPAPVAETGDDERRPMSRLRRTISANMAKSWAEIPHVTTFDDVDATRLLEVRRALGERHGTKIPVEALVIKAVVPALEQFPEFNASLEGDELVLHRNKDIGIAVDTPDGLLVAVIGDADDKSVMELAGEVTRLGEGARDRKLPPGELSGQTFTVSNIGAVGGGHGTPIVPYGTVGILSVGKARLRPVVYDEDLAIAPVMPLSLSYDHRVIDGAVGRRFMALVLENLEEPALFLAG
ncbi:MAG TPA: dihydrolipoamide acetyltransferase family protein [Acidimicrobiia bacterium]|nr:dihydrolipoamide acetyltransferase family protein [Acidimicrobiia bacterium]